MDEGLLDILFAFYCVDDANRPILLRQIRAYVESADPGYRRGLLLMSPFPVSLHR